MPWILELGSLLIVFVVLFVAGAGWALGHWLMNRILGALFK